MSAFLIAFFMAAGVAAWSYNKTQDRTGNNTESSIKVAAAVGIMAFIVTATVLSVIGSIID